MSVQLQTKARKSKISPLAPSGFLQRKCSKCRKKMDLLQRKPADRALIKPASHVAFESPSSSGHSLGLKAEEFAGNMFGHDLSRTPLHSVTPKASSSGLQIGPADDIYEQEADRIAESVMGDYSLGRSQRSLPLSSAGQSLLQRSQDDAGADAPSNKDASSNPGTAAEPKLDLYILNSPMWSPTQPDENTPFIIYWTDGVYPPDEDPGPYEDRIRILRDSDNTVFEDHTIEGIVWEENEISIDGGLPVSEGRLFESYHGYLSLNANRWNEAVERETDYSNNDMTFFILVNARYRTPGEGSGESSGSEGQTGDQGEEVGSEYDQGGDSGTDYDQGGGAGSGNDQGGAGGSGGSEGYREDQDGSGGSEGSSGGPA
jgi:hypothetical protein